MALATALLGLLLAIGAVGWVSSEVLTRGMESSDRIHKELFIYSRLHPQQLEPVSELNESQRQELMEQPQDCPDAWPPDVRQAQRLSDGYYSVEFVDLQGRIVSASHHPIALPQPVMARLALAQVQFQAAASVSDGGRLSWEEAGRDYLMIPLSHQGRVRGYVVVWGREITLKQATRRDLLSTLGFIAPFLTVIIFIKTGLIAAVVALPLEKLAECAGRVARGEVQERANFPSPISEIEQVRTTFNSMLEQVHNLLAAQKNFVADVSHELRTPLASLRGQLHVLRSSACGQEERRLRSLELCEKETLRMATLVEDLLQLMRAENEHRNPLQQEVDLSQVIDEALALTMPLFPNRSIESCASCTQTNVSGDFGPLVQAVRNVLGNALKYSEREVLVRLNSRPDALAIEIEDFGIGVAPNDLPHLGQRFFRADRSRSRESGGYGLGLAITRAILERCQGRLEFISEPGRGTTVTLVLPRRQR